MNTTKIEWADMTINPVVGCSHCSPGCDHCYAERFAARLAKNPKTAAKYRGVVDENGKWTGKINLHMDGCLHAATVTRTPKRFFIGSMTDIFHENIADEEIRSLFYSMTIVPNDLPTYIVLTKRPHRAKAVLGDMLLTCPELHRVWLGVSICNQAEADEKIPVLLQTPAAKRFVSVEPMLGPIDLVGWGGIRQGENPYPERWLNFAWPEWVPAKVRQEIESFWSWETYKRTPRQWADNAVQNCGGIALGSLVGVDNVTWKGSKTVRPYNDYRSYRTGRFVHAWNNMCRVVYDDGTFDYASYDGRFYLSEYCVPGTDKCSLINWVICGGETGPGARPMHPDWVRSLRDQCQAAGTPFFFKSWGEWAPRSNHPLVGYGVSASSLDPDCTRWECIRLTEQGNNGNLLVHSGEGEEIYMQRVGKRHAGRLLDGVEYNQFPK